MERHGPSSRNAAHPPGYRRWRSSHSPGPKGRGIMGSRRLHPVVVFVAVSALAMPFATGGQSAMAQPAPVVVAVAPFTDEVNLRDDLARLTSARLIALLSKKGVQVIPAAQMESALREVGFRPLDLVSLASNETLAHQLGADVGITGRLILADLEHEGTFIPDESPSRPPEAFVTLRLRLMVVATRRISYADFTGHAVGGLFGLAHAADRALQQYVDNWAAVTQP